MVKIHQVHRSELLKSASPDAIWKRVRRPLGRIAHDQRRFAVSPRLDKSFDVGVGTALWNPRPELICIGSSNYKQAIGPRQHKCPDQCGEMFSIATARTMKSKIIGMVVEAPPQPDDYSGFDVGVTVSCVFCRHEYRLELQDPDSPLTPETWLRFNHPTNKKIFFEKRVAAFLKLFPNDPKELDPKHLTKRGGP